MMRKMSFAALILLWVSALVVSVLAQGQPVPQNRPERIQRSQDRRQKMADKMMLIDKQTITLLKAKIREDGKADDIQIIPLKSNNSILRNGTLRIYLLDGSVQEIPIFSVKEVAIEHQGDVR